MSSNKPTLDELASSQHDDIIEKAAWNSTPLVQFLRKAFRIIGYGYLAVAFGTIPVVRFAGSTDHFKAIVGTFWRYGFGTLTILLVICGILWPVAAALAVKNYARGEANLTIEADQKKTAEDFERAREQARLFRRARMGTSPLANAIRLHSIALMILLAWGGTLMFAWNYLDYLWSGQPVPYDRDRFLLDPSKTGYAGLWPFVGVGLFFVVYFVLWDLAWVRSKKTFERELAWANALRIKVIGHLDVLSEGVSSPRLSIYYKGKVPEFERMEKLAAGLAKEKVEYERGRSDGLA